MNEIVLQEQVDTIRVAFSYINRFKGKTFVIKLDDGLLPSPLFPLLIKDIVLLHRMGIHIALIPGAQNRIDTILTQMNIPCKKVNNLRISTKAAMPFIQMAAFDVSNRIMTYLAENNQDAVIGNWVKARSVGIVDGSDYQFTGKIEKLKTGIIKKLIDDAMIPIFTNIGWSARGIPYNISTDELASTLSREIGAAKLFFITAREGIKAEGLKLPPGIFVSGGGLIRQLTVPQARELLKRNKTQKYSTDMRLLSLAIQTCEADVSRVHLIDGRVEGMLLKEIFSDQGMGTMVYNDPYENIRPAKTKDIPDLLSLMHPLVKQGLLIPRSQEHLREQLADFVVYETDGNIRGCGALHPHPGGQAEIAAMAVHHEYSRLGIGKKIVAYFIRSAVEKQLHEFFVLTTQAGDWFSSCGFEKAPIDSLPEEKRKAYNRKRNSLILKYELSAEHNREFFDL